MKTLSKSKGVKEIDVNKAEKVVHMNLMAKFMKENPQLLDDQIPDAFDEWVNNLESK